MKTVYPVIFTKTVDCVLVEVPDLQILTEGKDLGLKGISLEDAQLDIPAASGAECIDVSKGTFADEGTGIISMVDIDFMEYRRKVDNKTVRRNVTLPNWLNKEAEAAHINVSKVLQEALMVKLNVAR